MDYGLLLTTHRAFYPIDDLDYSVESDRGRVLSSSAFRRLQKRTQVFALELNASIRTRLTHSLEVAQTARFIAKTILQKLQNDDRLHAIGLQGRENAFISTVEVAAYLHDIGNPPFGHFGEATLNEYIKKYYIPVLTSLPGEERLKQALVRDIASFEGNAQAIRIVTKLQRLNLSYTQTLAILKYTRGAFESKEDAVDKSGFTYLTKKAGYYLSEQHDVETMRNEINIKKYHRFPLVYIMEAADDIAYLTADLEDAVDKGVMTLETLRDRIVEACEKENERFLKALVIEQYDRLNNEKDAPYRFNMFFTLLRAKLITKLVHYVADSYLARHEAIFQGALDDALLTCRADNELYLAVRILQSISIRYIYRAKAVQELELQGYNVLNALMKQYQPLVELSYDDFAALIQGKRVDRFIAEGLWQRISQKQRATYHADVKRLREEQSDAIVLWERYLRMRMVLDYIRGMTDDYALHEYRLLHAIS